MISEASALPPGESMRKTTASRPPTSRASRKACEMVSEPMISPPNRGLKLSPLGPRMMVPTAVTTAIFGPLKWRRSPLLVRAGAHDFGLASRSSSRLSNSPQSSTRSTSPASTASTPKNGARSMRLRTSSAERSRLPAMPSTICPITESSSQPVISRCSSVKPLSVYMKRAVL
jgi:hypothetical protein